RLAMVRVGDRSAECMRYAAVSERSMDTDDTVRESQHLLVSRRGSSARRRAPRRLPFRRPKPGPSPPWLRIAAKSVDQVKQVDQGITFLSHRGTSPTLRNILVARIGAVKDRVEVEAELIISHAAAFGERARNPLASRIVSHAPFASPSLNLTAQLRRHF